jgi:signal transduction histidine kinase
LTYTLNAPVAMLGDQTRLKQVFFNLLDNAIAYTPDGGSIRVSLLTDGSQAEVTVADSGIGILPEDMPHVFERFFRSEEARARNHEGTGLGLAIARQVVHAHQGRIGVSSEPGKGTTFQVLLPLQGPLTGPGATGRLSPVAIGWSRPG